MKKIMTLLFSIGLLLGLTSCGGGAPDIFTVSFETEYGTAPESFDVEDGTVLTAEQLKALTCEGYTFLGWFDGETEAKADEYKVTKDVTLTAKWEIVPPPAPTKYTVTFKSEYGKVPETITVEEGTVLSAEQLKALTAANYIFKGWFDGETEAKAGEYKVTKNVTLIAKWEPIPEPVMYKVTYKSDYATVPAAIEVEENTILSAEQLKALTTANYIFKGWFDGETEAKAGEYKVTKDVTLTAKWEFKFLGIYDCFTLPNNIQVRVTLNGDKTCALDLLLQIQQILNVTFKGTYTVEDALVKIDLDKEKLSATSGITWVNSEDFNWPSGITTAQIEEYFTKAKAGCVKIGEDKLIFTDQGYDFDFVPGKDFDERLIGAWEDSDESSRFLFNEDKTFATGFKMQKGEQIMYMRGTYVILQKYLKIIGTEYSQDNSSYAPIEEEDEIMVELVEYSFNDDGAIFNKMSYQKMSTTDITFNN